MGACSYTWGGGGGSSYWVLDKLNNECEVTNSMLLATGCQIIVVPYKKCQVARYKI